MEYWVRNESHDRKMLRTRTDEAKEGGKRKRKKKGFRVSILTKATSSLCLVEYFGQSQGFFSSFFFFFLQKGGSMIGIFGSIDKGDILFFFLLFLRIDLIELI